MYKATVTKSLSDLKMLDHSIVLIASCMFGGLVGFFGPEFTIYGLMLLLLLLVIWLATGQLRWRPRKGELLISNENLRLTWMNEEEITVDLEAISPKYQLAYYRPLGILPKKPYIHLMLEGGLLGPHEFFFFHDGEYNASQWDKLPLQQIVDGVGIVNA